tara:strand:- start:1847 stop:2353 length:507 start_codon:yes stop_codon:yes gene_type:complete
MIKNLWQNQDFEKNKKYWSIKEPSESLRIRIENLSTISDILKYNNIFFFLEGQTLNHVFRYNCLDPSDHDDDIGVYYKNRKRILNLNDTFNKNGFKIIRINDKMISVCRHNRYIDICLFKNTLLKTGYGNKKFSKKYYQKFNTLIFENIEFKIPNYTEEFLKTRYEIK